MLLGCAQDAHLAVQQVAARCDATLRRRSSRAAPAPAPEGQPEPQEERGPWGEGAAPEGELAVPAGQLRAAEAEAGEWHSHFDLLPDCDDVFLQRGAPDEPRAPRMLNTRGPCE